MPSFTFSTSLGRDKTSGKPIKLARVSIETREKLYSVLFVQGLLTSLTEVNGEFVAELPNTPLANRLKEFAASPELTKPMLDYLNVHAPNSTEENHAWWELHQLCKDGNI